MRTPVSSSTSRATRASKVSPASTKPASVVITPSGCRGDRASRILSFARFDTAQIIAGSLRGNETVPHFSQVRAWPALPNVQGPPQMEQKPERRFHVTSAVAARATWFSLKLRNGPCTRVSRKRASSVSRVASTAKSGAPSSVPRNVAVATSPKRAASARASRSSLPSASKSALPPSQTT